MRLILIVLAFSLPALAAPSPEMLELGKKEFEAGSRDFDLGNYDKSLDHFESSYKLTGKAALLFNIARVYEFKYRRNRRVEDLTAAVERLRTYLALTADDGEALVLPLRARAQSALKSYESELAKERAKRARGEEALQLGEEALEAGRFTDALAQVDKYEHASGNERQGLVRAFVLRAFVSFATGDADNTVNWFARALSLDKSLALPPTTVEKLRVAFAAAKARLQGRDVENTTHAPPAGLKPGQPIDLTFVTVDPEHLVAAVQLHYRVGGGGAYSKTPVGADGKVTLPRSFTQQLQSGMKIEYYADILDANGAFLEHLGTDAVPFSTMVGKPPSPSVAKRWWFWTTVGIVVVGAAIGGGLGYYYTRTTPPPDLPLNTGLTVGRW